MNVSFSIRNKIFETLNQISRSYHYKHKNLRNISNLKQILTHQLSIQITEYWHRKTIQFKFIGNTLHLEYILIFYC